MVWCLSVSLWKIRADNSIENADPLTSSGFLAHGESPNRLSKSYNSDYVVCPPDSLSPLSHVPSIRFRLRD